MTYLRRSELQAAFLSTSSPVMRRCHRIWPKDWPRPRKGRPMSRCQVDFQPDNSSEVSCFRMHEQVLRDFLIGSARGLELSQDLIGALVLRGAVTNHPIIDMSEEFH